VLFAGLVLLHGFYLSRELNVLSKQGILRKRILEKIASDYPALPPKTVFYVESDTSFYGLSDETKILPFQTNFGHTLFVWYLPKTKYPKEFLLDSSFLYNLSAQGYAEYNGRGYGYYREFDSLTDSLKKNNLTAESVFAYKYFSKNETLYNITNEVRENIENGGE
jgi:hypothetical protein